MNVSDFYARYIKWTMFRSNVPFDIRSYAADNMMRGISLFVESLLDFDQDSCAVSDTGA